MFATFLVLKEEDKLNEILSIYREIGIQGATIFDSIGIDKEPSDSHVNVPLISSLSKLFEPRLQKNKTIISLVQDIVNVEKISNATEKILGKLQSTDKGIFFAVPVATVCGLSSEPAYLELSVQ
jgi:hypothetical protein